MTRNLELHDRFADWLAARASGAAEDPPRDLALHAAGCERCLRSATAIDTLEAIDVGAAAPPLRADPIHNGPGGWVQTARYAVAGAALILVAGSVAIGSGWLGDRRPAESAAVRATPAEGVLAGAPSHTGRALSTPSPFTSPSERQSPSAEASEAPSDDTSAPQLVTPKPTSTPLPPPIRTVAPSAAPTITAAPTRTPTPAPTSTPVPTLAPTDTPIPTPTSTSVPDDCADGLDNDGDTFIDVLDPGCILDGNESSQ